MRHFLTQAKIEMTGASIESFLNAMTRNRVHFSQIERHDDLHFSVVVAEKDAEQTQKIALHTFCNVESVKKWGIREQLRRLRKRPVLVIAIAIVIALSFAMQSVVFAIDISGNKQLREEEILRGLAANGIAIGKSADVDQQLTKHRMLNTLPQLSWIGVNRNGFRLNVLVTERSTTQSNRPHYRFANIISAKDATLTRQMVFEGMSLVKIGDAVKKGQTLVSGFEDYGLILKGVCAEAEIYGRTWYTGTVLMPKKIAKKRYTGRSWTQYSLIIGRKRINLCGNSSFLGTSCDKIIEVFQLSVPGYEFPVRLEKIIYREYEKISIAVDTAEEQLKEAWRKLVLSQMIAGKIEETETSFRENGDVFSLYCQSTCEEMIGRLVPMEPVFEGETNE